MSVNVVHKGTRTPATGSSCARQTSAGTEMGTTMRRSSRRSARQCSRPGRDKAAGEVAFERTITERAQVVSDSQWVSTVDHCKA